MSDGAMIETVRGFNRIVTQRVGALQNSYLARDRTLAESRGIRCVEVDLALLRGEREPELTLFAE